MNTFIQDHSKHSVKWRELLALVRREGGTKEGAQKVWHDINKGENWINDTYHVYLVKDEPHGFGDVEVWWLSIKRHDREVICDWREFQEIKNAICGEQYEGIMLYPRETRVVDTSNQFHLFVFMDEDYVIPCGFMAGSKTDDPNFGKAKQRSRS